MLNKGKLMKQTYILLLGAITFLSASCMERERPHYYSTENNQLINPMPVYLATQDYEQFLHYSLQQQNSQYICTATEPGWEILNAVGNARYTNNHNGAIQQQSTPTCAINSLTPTFHRKAQSKQYLHHQETKSLLHKPMQIEPDKQLMQKLYDQAFKTLFTCPSKQNIIAHYHNELRQLIIDIQTAKNNNITQDGMAIFAHNLPNPNFGKNYIALLCYIVKQYFITTQNTPESFPPSYDECTMKIGDNDLAELLSIKGTESTNNTLQSHPIYSTLLNSLLHLIKNDYNNGVVNMTISYLHENNMNIPNNNQPKPYEDLKRDFYYHGYRVLFNTKAIPVTDNIIYNLIEITHQIKQHNKDETDLGYDILNFDPTESSYLWRLSSLMLGACYDIPTKNKISLLCTILKKYHLTRGCRSTPDDKQYFCYLNCKNLKLSLPDNFDKRLFDEQEYALNERTKISQDIKRLKQLNDVVIQVGVDQTYPAKK